MFFATQDYDYTCRNKTLSLHKTLFVLFLMIMWESAGLLLANNAVDYSDLPPDRQFRIRQKVSAPPLSSRDAPYATPMYYLMHQGFSDGDGQQLQLRQNRPHWQEVLMRDWAELGLTATHFLVTPSHFKDPHQLQALHDYLDLSEKYGMKVGLRLSGDETLGALEGNGWKLHPNNPDNRIEEYLDWVSRVATFFQKKAVYYIVGDELSPMAWEQQDAEGKTVRKTEADPAKQWDPQTYLQVFSRIAQTIHDQDPDVPVSMFASNGLRPDYVKGLLDAGYGNDTSAFAANLIHSRVSPPKLNAFLRMLKSRISDYQFVSSGVGYVAARDTKHYPVNHGEKPVLDDQAQGVEVARMMFTCFEAGMDYAPYYITLRQWVLPDGSTAPHWYGFFGFTDFCVDEYDHLTVKRYPAWYAFQTIAHIFYSRTVTQPAPFELKLSQPVDFQRVYLRNDYELLIVLWNDEAEPREVSLTIRTRKFIYPVQVNLFNYQLTSDVSYCLMEKDKLHIPQLQVGRAPVILRLVAESR